MPPVVSALCAASATLLAAYAFGRLANRDARLPCGAHLAVGSALLSTAVFALLASGGLRRASLVALVLLIAGLAVWRERSRLAAFSRLRLPSRPPLAALSILGLFGFLYLICALAPDTQPDSTGYHLGLVNEWMRTRLIADRVAFHEMLPHGLEMLFLMAFAFGRHSAATLVHFGFLLATLPLILRVAGKLGLPGWAGAAGAVFYFCAPVVAIDGTSAYNDAALAFFALAVFDLLLEQAPGWTAGVCAGFCYAIKSTGGVAVLAGIGWLLIVARRPKAALGFTAGALALMLPWMIRNQVMAGSPVAPFFTSILPTPYFHASTQRVLLERASPLARVPLAELPLEVTIRGDVLQGLTGPVFLLLPLALLALRERAGRLLLAAAAVAALPWLGTSGTRFLIPALPFAALALALALERIAPGRAPAAVALLGAAACLPPVTAAYVPPHAWTLRRIPWRAALRIESPREYLGRELWASAVSDMVDRHTQPNDLVFDVSGLPYAYVRWIPVGPWQSATGERLALALENAWRGPALGELVVRWPEASIRALRVRPTRDWTLPWSAVEIVPLRGDTPVVPGRDWITTASPYPAEAAFAIDGNFASEYRSWEPARPSMFWEVRLPAPQPLSGVRIVARDLAAAGGLLEVSGQDASGRWQRLSHDYTLAGLPAADLRWSATRLFRREEIGWLVMPGQDSAWVPITRAMLGDPGKWGLEVVDSALGFHLFRVRWGGRR